MEKLNKFLRRSRHRLKNCVRKVQRRCSGSFLLRFCSLFILVFVLVLLWRHWSMKANVRIVCLENKDSIGSTFEEFGGIWDIFGWSYYSKGGDVISQFSDLNGAFKDLDEGSDDSDGFWVFHPSAVPSELNSKDAKYFYQTPNWISLRRFQFTNPAPLSLGIDLLLRGQMRLEFRFRDSHNFKETLLYVDSNNNTQSLIHGQNLRFCKQIVSPLPLYTGIDKITINAIPYEANSFAIINRIYVSLGWNEGSRNLLYTLLPQNWCRYQIHYEPNEE